MLAQHSVSLLIGHEAIEALMTAAPHADCVNCQLACGQPHHAAGETQHAGLCSSMTHYMPLYKLAGCMSGVGVYQMGSR